MPKFSDTKDYTSLSDKVYQYLRDGIAEGRYVTGDCLVEMKIAEELDVSRTPVREALKQLELEDLVDSQPNRGVIVKAFTSEDLRDVFTIRHLLEGQAAYWAAERITDAQLGQLREIVDLMEFYTQKNDVPNLVKLDSRFHEILYDASNSRTLKHILTSLHHNISRARKSSLNEPQRPAGSLSEHQHIFDAVSRHDAPAAKAYMEKHVDTASVYHHND